MRARRLSATIFACRRRASVALPAAADTLRGSERQSRGSGAASPAPVGRLGSQTVHRPAATAVGRVVTFPFGQPAQAVRLQHLDPRSTLVDRAGHAEMTEGARDAFAG